MGSTSQNGWPAFTSYGDPGLVGNPTVPGTDVKILGGVVAGVDGEKLVELAAGFHSTVEELRQELGCWGFEPRLIRGSTQLSNHASGTAIDLNAAAHPLGVEGTFTPQQVSAIRALLGLHDGMIRWGGDYSGRVDEMHFELTRDHSGGAGPVGGGAAGYPLPGGCYYGPYSGPNESISGSGRNDGPYREGLARAQTRMGVDADGYYGPNTAAAVRTWQAEHGLSIDGLIGPDTWRSYGF